MRKKLNKNNIIITEYDTALDKPDGMFLDSSETIIEEAEVKNAVKHGTFYRRDEYNDGIYFAQGSYKNGKLNGLYFESYADELYTLEIEVMFKDGKLDGAYIVRDEIKAEEEKGFFRNGKIDGPFIKYDIFNKKPRKKIEGNFKNGKRDGLWQFYYSDNKKPFFLEYENGRIKAEYLKALSKEDDFFKKNFSIVLSEACIMENVLKESDYSSSFKIRNDDFETDIFADSGNEIYEKNKLLHETIDKRKQIKFKYKNKNYNIVPYCLCLNLENEEVRCYGYDLIDNKWVSCITEKMKDIKEGEFEKEFNLDFEKNEKLNSELSKYVILHRATYEKAQNQRRLLLKVSLIAGKGKKFENIFKMILIPEDYSLLDFARIILFSYGFFIDHRFGFYDNFENTHKLKEGYEMFADAGEESKFPGVKDAKIKDVFNFTGKSMLFLFDYGDKWKFSVEYLSDDINRKH